jgi:hypothetical protein
MKLQQLRKIIREEIENNISGRSEPEYVLVDADEPLREEGPVFMGNLDDLKNQLLIMLQGGDLHGYDLMSVDEYESMMEGSI